MSAIIAVGFSPEWVKKTFPFAVGFSRRGESAKKNLGL